MKIKAERRKGCSEDEFVIFIDCDLHNIYGTELPLTASQQRHS
jgi:hypothetical protein